jgi:hypothetical protein
MLKQSKKIAINRELDWLRRDNPRLESVIAEAEVRFRDEELQHDWSSQPIEMEGVSPLPLCWKAGIEYAAPIAIAYADARARKATDPVKFEQFTEDVVAAVGEDTLLIKLSDYARIPGNFSGPVIDRFVADVRAATKRAMKRFQRDVWKRCNGMPRPRVESAPDTEARPVKPASRKPAAKKKAATRRKPLPNVVELVAGKEFISPEHAQEWFGTSDRNLRKLAASGRIEVRGEGQNRQISVASLRRYFAV